MNINELRESGIKKLFKIYDYANIINPHKRNLEKDQEVWDKLREIERKWLKGKT